MKDVSMMVENIKFNYRVGLLIIKDDKVLVEMSPVYDFSVIPGGRVKTFENTKDALVREVEEEMHITIDKNEIELSAFFENFFELDMIKYHELFVVYKLIIKDDRFDNASVNYDSDTNYYKWVKKEELSNINLLPKALKDLVDSDSFKHIIINELEEE